MKKFIIEPNPLPPVALNSPSAIENLPYPKVHYPNHYGTFITFTRLNEGIHTFCQCARNSIDNYLTFKNLIDDSMMITNDWDFNKYFSNIITKRSNNQIHYDEIFKYKPNLCHKCNNAVRSLRWCIELYGRKFTQYFGWYINQNKLRLGYYMGTIIPDRCPLELIKLIKHATKSGKVIRFPNDEDMEYDSEEYHNIDSSVNRYISKLTRNEFGY